MYELADYELDAVAAGQQGGVAGAAGLVGVAANVFVQNLLNRNDVDIEVLNNNNVQVGAGVAVAILGAAAGGASNVMDVVPL